MSKKQKQSLSTLYPSAKFAFKSSYYVEDAFWDANIKVDYDTNRNPLNIDKISNTINKIFSENHNYKCKYRISTIAIFSTGKGHHLRIWLKTRHYNGIYNSKPIPSHTILNLQEALGDDPKRIKFNRARVRRGEPYWNVLWRAKWKNGKLISSEEFCVDLTSGLLSKIDAPILTIHTSLHYIHQK